MVAGEVPKCSYLLQFWRQRRIAIPKSPDITGRTMCRILRGHWNLSEGRVSEACHGEFLYSYGSVDEIAASLFYIRHSLPDI